MLEHKFQKQVKKRLTELPNCYQFTKEAASLRGISDIIGCCNGRFFAWELKKSEEEANKKTGRIVLQRYHIDLVKKAGGIGRIVHPGNLESCLKELWTISSRTS